MAFAANARSSGITGAALRFDCGVVRSAFWSRIRAAATGPVETGEIIVTQTSSHETPAPGSRSVAWPASALAATWPLLLGMGVLMLGMGLQSTLLGVRATLEGFPTVVTGAIMSCYYVGYLLGTRMAPPLVRRLGHIRVFAALAAISSASILVQGSFVGPFTWGVMRGVTGLCLAGIYVVAESWLNDRASRENRGRLFAIYMVVLYVGLGAGQFLLILARPSTTAPFMLVSVLVSLALVPILVSSRQVPEHGLPRTVRLRELYRDTRWTSWRSRSHEIAECHRPNGALTDFKEFVLSK